MSHLQDLIRLNVGSPDETINDSLLKFYRDNGAVSYDINDAEYEYLLHQGMTPAHIDDMWDQYFEGLGYGGAFNDAMKTFWSATVHRPLTSSLTDGWGPALAHVRATPQNVADWEGIVREILPGEAGFTGARRAYNLLGTASSENINDGVWLASGTATIDDATTIGFPNDDNSTVYFSLPSILSIDIQNRSFIFSVELSGSGTVLLDVGRQTGAFEQGTVTITLTPTPKRYRVNKDFVAGGNTGITIKLRRQATTATSVTVTKMLPEESTGQADTTIPSEYVSKSVLSTPWHGAGVDGVKDFKTTNGNTVTANVVTEGIGLPLHPGYKYLKRADSTAYVVGDRRITANKDGRYYQCTVAGTSAASPPDFDRTIGNTTVDGTVTWLNKGYYTLDGFQNEPQSANNALHARDFTNAVWVKTNITPVKDATGINGVANSASTLTSTVANGTCFQTIVLSIADYATSFYVKRKTGTGTIEITDDGGTTYTAITLTSDYQRFDITQNQANPQIGFRVVTSGDEIEVDASQCEAGKFPSSFIETTTVAVTRNKSELTFPDTGVYLDSIGTAMCDWMPHYDLVDTTSGGNDILTTSTSNRLLYLINAKGINSYDGTNFLQGTLNSIAYTEYNVACMWNGATKRMVNGGVEDVNGAYDGSWNGGGTIRIGGRVGGTNTDSSNIKNVRFYKQELLAA